MEQWLYAFHGLLGHAGAAWAEVAAGAERAEIERALLGGRPDWSGEPASLHELFAGIP